MSIGDLVVWGLIAAGTALVVASAIGVWVFREDADDALHLTGPATVLAPVPIAAAVVVEEGPTSMAGAKAVLVALLLMTTGPVAGHATARARRIREEGGWRLREDERRSADEL